MTKGKTISSSKWYLLGRTLCGGSPLNIWYWILFLRTIQLSLHINPLTWRKSQAEQNAGIPSGRYYEVNSCLTTFESAVPSWALPFKEKNERRKHKYVFYHQSSPHLADESKPNIMRTEIREGLGTHLLQCKLSCNEFICAATFLPERHPGQLVDLPKTPVWGQGVHAWLSKDFTLQEGQKGAGFPSQQGRRTLKCVDDHVCSP